MRLILVLLGLLALPAWADVSKQSVVKSFSVQEEIDEPKVLALIVSDRKPIFLSQLIQQLKRQSWPHLTIGIGVKGVSEEWTNKLFLQEYARLIDDGTLYLSHVPDGTPLGEVADALKIIPAKVYDMICLLRDENWYHPDYVETAAKAFEFSTPMTALTLSNMVWLTREKEGIVSQETRKEIADGNICFSPKILAQIRKGGEDEGFLKSQLPEALRLISNNLSASELIYHIARNEGFHKKVDTDEPMMMMNINMKANGEI